MVGFGEKHEKIHRDVEILAPMSPEIGYIWFLHVENREAFVSPSSDIVPFLLCWVSIRRFPTVWDLVTLWQGVGRNLRLRAMCEVFPPPKKAHIALFLRWENKRFDSVVSTIVKIHFTHRCLFIWLDRDWGVLEKIVFFLTDARKYIIASVAVLIFYAWLNPVVVRTPLRRMKLRLSWTPQKNKDVLSSTHDGTRTPTQRRPMTTRTWISMYIDT